MTDTRPWGKYLARIADFSIFTRRNPESNSLPVVCFSHLRWTFVWQRPQHLLTRFSRQRPVYFVEEPLQADGEDVSNLVVTSHGDVTVLTPVLSASEYQGPGFNAGNNKAIRALLSAWLPAVLSGPNVVAWYYTPMALGALPDELEASATIFDAMDELSKFRGAPAALKERERTLMQVADLVFAGGPSLHEARKSRHPRAFCFASGVDAKHFSTDGLSRPEDIDHLSGPIIGFYGVIDERIDLDLVAGIADMRPDWTILMIGPLAKITESDLPRRANIHYPGMRTYDQLPAYLAGFDAAILPFAINEATRFISPTKTLEYLSGGKPVVSTAIKDVIDLYGNVVEIASNPEEFVQAIEYLWNESPEQQQVRARQVEQTLKQHDWDLIASGMMDLLNSVLEQPAGVTAGVAGATNHVPVEGVPAVALRREMAD